MIFITPDDLREKAKALYQRRWKAWLLEDNDEGVSLSVGPPKERDVLHNAGMFKTWLERWKKEQASGSRIEYRTSHWKSVGQHQIPVKIIFPTRASLTSFAGTTSHWKQLRKRHHTFLTRFPESGPTLTKNPALLEGPSDEDFTRFLDVLTWFRSHPRSGLFLRQVSVPGVHSKWIENHKRLLRPFLTPNDQASDASFHDVAGLTKEPALILMRLLDEELTRHSGGMKSFQAGIGDLCQMQWPVKRVFIIENRQTGWALPPVPGAVAFIGLGYGVRLLGKIPWIHGCECYYWGDLDADGMMILDRARSVFPQIRSVLMDFATLSRHKDYQTANRTAAQMSPEHLSHEESLVLTFLQENRIRLEQEHLPWDYCLEVLSDLEKIPINP